MSMYELVQKQKQLMDYVPHDVTPQALAKMMAGAKIIDTLLRFLNSTGHKPWRPKPLDPQIQSTILDELEDRVGFLRHVYTSGTTTIESTPDVKHYARQVVSAFGVIEETVEHLQTLGVSKPDRPHQLEELVDSLFFWMEQMILGGFTWEEVEQEYGRKWEENMERYRRAKKGDYGWDRRSKGTL